MDEPLIVVPASYQQPATCACAARKCAPHRCRLSWCGWLTVSGLLVYLLVMHSLQFAERADWRTTFATEIRAQARGEAALTTRDVIEHWNAEITDTLIHRAETLLHRAELLTWALATPEIERDVQLKQALETLTARPDE